jgi:hypothetical protein
MNSKTQWLGAVAGVCLAALSATAEAHAPSDPALVGDIAKLSAASNLIIQGKVKSVAYRNHAVSGREMPFAYVTYSVTGRMLGSAGNEITLRFIGGPDGRGGFVAAEGVPAFSPGDEDILFVKSNGDNGCPLVMCEFGRFRVLNGLVHDGHGEPVSTLTNGRMRAGGKTPPALQRTTYPAPSFDELIKNPSVLESIRQMGLTIDQARAKYAKEAAKEIVVETRESEATTEPGATSARAPVTPGVQAASVLNAIRMTVASQRRATPALIQNADPARFTAPSAINPASPK